MPKPNRRQRAVCPWCEKEMDPGKPDAGFGLRWGAGGHLNLEGEYRLLEHHLCMACCKAIKQADHPMLLFALEGGAFDAQPPNPQDRG